jgi:group I intron endonuclease
MTEPDSKPYGVIYCITHKETERVYVGQTVSSIAQRWASHKAQSCCVLLHRAIKKYGAEAFSVEQIDKADSKVELDELEAFYISAFCATRRDRGFNLRDGGSFGKHSDESKKKMSIAVRKAYENPEFKAKLSASHKGKKKSKDECARASARMTGTKLPEGVKQKLSGIVKSAWESDAYRQKVTDGQRVARADAGYIKLVSENTKSQWVDIENRQSLVDAQTAGKRAMWADPERKAAFLAKRRATLAAKKAAQI